MQHLTISLYADLNISTCTSLQMLLHSFMTSILIGLSQVHKRADQTKFGRAPTTAQGLTTLQSVDSSSD